MEENNVENEEVKEIEEGNNGIKIANDVISVIAGVAVSEVPGVASMAGGFAKVSEVNVHVQGVKTEKEVEEKEENEEVIEEQQ